MLRKCVLYETFIIKIVSEIPGDFAALSWMNINHYPLQYFGIVIVPRCSFLDSGDVTLLGTDDD